MTGKSSGSELKLKIAALKNMKDKNCTTMRSVLIFSRCFFKSVFVISSLFSIIELLG